MQSQWKELFERGIFISTASRIKNMMDDVKSGSVSSAAGFDGQAGEAAGARPLFTDGRRWQLRGSKKLEDKKEGFTLTLVSESLSSSGPYDKKDGLKLVRSFSGVLTNMCHVQNLKNKRIGVHLNLMLLVSARDRASVIYGIAINWQKSVSSGLP